ncbi:MULTISPECIES: hypothetical protein [Allobaculum]|uniref:hypothetical protein n=1 Tax=Allobaculum TaxID=174708 RepID=UPI001E4090A2|nr:MULTISPECIES: hypothetical protein [Allobaculum]UNT92830.1 hypothetical protein KWG61_12240 [Allobaculum sp. Allo2]
MTQDPGASDPAFFLGKKPNREFETQLVCRSSSAALFLKTMKGISNAFSKSAIVEKGV